MSDTVLHVGDSDFAEQVLQSDVPVLVDFWAEWCGPCRMLGPILEEVAKEMQGKVKIVKVNVDENQEIPTQHGVRGIPTLILFKDGKVIANKVGAMPKAALIQFLNDNI